jgi:hypothetical protein
MFPDGLVKFLYICIVNSTMLIDKLLYEKVTSIRVGVLFSKRTK